MLSPKLILIAVAISLLLAVGCATTSDPSKGGILDYFVHKDDYKKRALERKRLLAKLEKDNQRLSQEKEQLKEEYLRKEQELNDLKVRLDKMNRSLAKLRHNIHGQSQIAREKRSQVELLERQRSKLKRELAKIKANKHLSQNQIQSRITQLQKEIDELEDAVIKLGGL